MIKIRLNNRLQKRLFESVDSQKDEILRKWGYDPKKKIETKVDVNPVSMSAFLGICEQPDGMSSPQPKHQLAFGKLYEAGTVYPLKKWKYTLFQLLGVKSQFAAWRPIVKYLTNISDIFFTWNDNIDTMATDGASIAMNPVFFQGLLDICDGKWSAVLFVLVHELYHIILRHNYRGEGISMNNDSNIQFDRDTSNIAADYEVNISIVNELGERSKINPQAKMTVWDGNFVSDTIGGYYDEKYNLKSYEDIYRDIYKTKKMIDEGIPQEIRKIIEKAKEKALAEIEQIEGY